MLFSLYFPYLNFLHISWLFDGWIGGQPLAHISHGASSVTTGLLGNKQTAIENEERGWHDRKRGACGKVAALRGYRAKSGYHVPYLRGSTRQQNSSVQQHNPSGSVMSMKLTADWRHWWGNNGSRPRIVTQQRRYAANWRRYAGSEWHGRSSLPCGVPVSTLAHFVCSSVLLFFYLYFIFVTLLVLLRLQCMFVQLN